MLAAILHQQTESRASVQRLLARVASPGNHVPTPRKADDDPSAVVHSDGILPRGGGHGFIREIHARHNGVHRSRCVRRIPAHPPGSYGPAVAPHSGPPFNAEQLSLDALPTAVHVALGPILSCGICTHPCLNFSTHLLCPGPNVYAASSLCHALQKSDAHATPGSHGCHLPEACLQNCHVHLVVVLAPPMRTWHAFEEAIHRILGIRYVRDALPRA